VRHSAPLPKGNGNIFKMMHCPIRAFLDFCATLWY